MDERAEKVDRQQLFDAVWSEPVSKVAARYGLSDVGLAKICRKMAVPVPTRGYWAKIKAGGAMRRPPLPSDEHATWFCVTLSRADPDTSARRISAKQEAAKLRESTADIVLPTELVDPLPLIRAASKRLKQRDGWSDEKGLRSAPGEVLHLEVTPSALDRALLIMDTLLKALAERRISVRVHTKDKITILDVDGTSVPLMISEHVRRTDHEITPAEQKARDRYYKQSRWGNASISYPHIPRYDFHPTGILTVTAGRWPTRTWKDTPRTLLERRLGEIVIGIITLAAEIKVKQEEDARRQDARRRAQDEYEYRKQQLEQERAALKQLESDAASWARANHLRAYIAAVELQSGLAGELTPEQTEWIAWARAKADGIDPLVAVSDPILDAPEPKPPGYLWY